jgi:hypothetical protein
MLPLILSLLIASQTSLSKGEELLNKMADRFSHAEGIIWVIESQTYSPVFEDTTKETIGFTFNPPDTFCYASDSEQVVGVADTIWVLSKKHKQIQKKLAESFLKPTDFFIGWKDRYILKDYHKNGDMGLVHLEGKEGVTPSDVRLKLEMDGQIYQIFYKDISGDEVTLRIAKQRLVRSPKINLFYEHIPKGYKLVDLTE